MRTFRVKVNGKQYEVEIEEIGHLAAVARKTQAAQSGAVAPSAAPPKPAAVASPVAATSADGSITAPMPGTVLNVVCSQGDHVKKGDVLLVLEAMKMENEIQAPADGTVSTVAVSKGQSVDAGELLIQLGN